MFEVKPQIAVEIEGKTVFIFRLSGKETNFIIDIFKRHFLDWKAMTVEQQKSILVASASVKEGSYDVNFIKPLFIDEEYCLIERTSDSWFWVILIHI